MISKEQLSKLVKAIKAEPELNGCIIGFHGNNQSQVLDSGNTPSINFGRVIVIIEETEVGAPSSSSSSPNPATSVPSSQPTEVDKPNFVANKSKVAPELIGTGISCGFAVISGIGVLGSAAAEVPSAGTSTILLVVAWTGFVTSAIQCTNGIVRGIEVLSNPDGNSLQQWDDNAYYSNFILAVDAIGIVSTVVTLPKGVMSLQKLMTQRGLLRSADEMAALSRAERQQVMKEAIKRLSQTPEGKAAVMQAMKDAGMTEAQAAAALKKGIGGLDKSTSVMSSLSKPASKRLNAQIKELFLSGANVAASASSAEYTGSASGSVNWVIVHAIAR